MRFPLFHPPMITLKKNVKRLIWNLYARAVPHLHESPFFLRFCLSISFFFRFFFHLSLQRLEISSWTTNEQHWSIVGNLVTWVGETRRRISSRVTCPLFPSHSLFLYLYSFSFRLVPSFCLSLSLFPFLIHHPQFGSISLENNPTHLKITTKVSSSFLRLLINQLINSSSNNNNNNIYNYNYILYSL